MTIADVDNLARLICGQCQAVKEAWCAMPYSDALKQTQALVGKIKDNAQNLLVAVNSVQADWNKIKV